MGCMAIIRIRNLTILRNQRSLLLTTNCIKQGHLFISSIAFEPSVRGYQFKQHVSRSHCSMSRKPPKSEVKEAIISVPLYRISLNVIRKDVSRIAIL
jgi:hypothetical protein